MNIAITIVAVVLVIAGVFFSQFSKKEIQTSETSQVLSVEEEKEEEQVTPTVASDRVENPSPGQRPSGPAATNTPKPSSNNLSSFQYPNSQVVSSIENSLILNSIDNSDAITAWYEEKIKAEGMSVNIFNKQKLNNDVVSNTLVGADGQGEIRVEITKDAGSSTVNISVAVTTD